MQLYNKNGIILTETTISNGKQSVVVNNISSKNFDTSVNTVMNRLLLAVSTVALFVAFVATELMFLGLLDLLLLILFIKSFITPTFALRIRDNSGFNLEVTSKDKKILEELNILIDEILSNKETSNLDLEQNGIEQLEKLAKLKEKGLLTDKEFESQKSKILSSLA